MALIKRCQNLIIDSNALIFNSPLQVFGLNIFTVSSVIDEIKDENTRRRLSILPYQLIIKDVEPKYIQKVISASKETGDFPILSTTDIKVLSLALQVMHEKIPLELKMEESNSTSELNLSWKQDENVYNLPGFYNPENSLIHEEANVNILVNDLNKKLINDLIIDDNNPQHLRCTNEIDDDTSWITPTNLTNVLGIESNDKESSIDIDEVIVVDTDKVDGEICIEDFVACLTDDFAMQNVCFKLGIPVRASKDGNLIKSLRHYVIFCKACLRTTSDIDKKFCPHCGNRSLTRVPFSVDAEGNKTLHVNPQRLHRKRGLKYSLPLPQGGKHPNLALIKENQKRPQNVAPMARSQKKNKKNKLLGSDDPSYSPFALNDINSRAFNALGLISRPRVAATSNLKRNRR